MTEFPEQLPHDDVVEVLPDIFFVTGQVRPHFGGNALQFSRNMVVLRDNEDLTLINTLRLDEAGLARLDSLGTVRHIVRLGAFHGRDDAFYADRYDATFWAPGNTTYDRGESADEVLAAGQPGPTADASVFEFESTLSPEVILR